MPETPRRRHHPLGERRKYLRWLCHFVLPRYEAAEETAYRHAELFYLQKQIQSQTPMVIVLADGGKVEGCIEWYDRRALKVRGREKTLIYKSAIKYMYKLGETAQ